jgi:L-ascorbate metabolism protein UlaG (beta-lactamase superfamily)
LGGAAGARTIEFMEITHIGGPTTVILARGLRIVTDPTFDPPGGKYPGGGWTLEKSGTPAHAVSDIEPLDLVLLSHDEHADNLDAAGRALLARVPLVLTTVSGAARLGGSARGLAPWESIDVPAASGGTVRVTAVPGRHGPPGSEPIVGDVIGFLVTWAGQERGALYVSGDTVWYEDVAAIGQRTRIGTAIVHLGRVTAPDGSQLTMSASDLPALTEALDPLTLVPVHVEGWTHFSESRAAAEQILAQTPSAARVRWLEPGVATTFAD